jgi:glycosyltransferase involved in cell wall biosynthesis
MRVIVTTESRFTRTPDGAVWTQEGPAYPFFTQYLSAFDQVRVVSRVLDVPTAPAGAHRVDGPSVEVWPVPYYVGPSQYLRRWRDVHRSVRASADADDSVILRVPSVIGAPLAAQRRRQRRPYALEVIGDPYDVFAPGTVQHPLRPWLRLQSTAQLRRLCRSATAVAYVTERHLQARYPAGPGAVTANYSSGDMPPSAFVSAPRGPDPGRTTFSLLSIGSLELMYKGIDTLLEALARLVAAGLDVRLTHLGDGRCRPRLEQLAARLAVADRVVLTGMLPAGDPVREQLDAADLFVIPSRTEGLPRALIEAMARGLPAIGSTAGGIPELLPAEFLVPPDDPATLATAIRRLLADSARMASASATNLARAGDYHAASLRARRDSYYSSIADATRQRTLVGSA